MRKVNGANLTINELKSIYFGYSEKVDFSKIVERIVVNDMCYATTEENDIVCFPINFLDDDKFPNFDKTPNDFEITVYDFINNYWGLDEFGLEEFDFYFLF
jgi:hypothetical protein